MVYHPKDGECQRVCCGGVRGPIILREICSPSSECQGFSPEEKEEDGHCPGEAKGTCQCDKGDRLTQRMYLTPFAAVFSLWP